jgi:hypothetical protein
MDLVCPDRSPGGSAPQGRTCADAKAGTGTKHCPGATRPVLPGLQFAQITGRLCLPLRLASLF